MNACVAKTTGALYPTFQQEGAILEKQMIFAFTGLRLTKLYVKE